MFQQILIVVVGLLFLGSLWALYRGWTGRKEGLIWSAVWLAAGVAVLWPQVTSRIAHALNIGRGADLILYCAVIVMLAGFWMMYARLRRLRHDITLLVRHLALDEAEREFGRSSPPAEPHHVPDRGTGGADNAQH